MSTDHLQMEKVSLHFMIFKNLLLCWSMWFEVNIRNFWLLSSLPYLLDLRAMKVSGQWQNSLSVLCRSWWSRAGLLPSPLWITRLILSTGCSFSASVEKFLQVSFHNQPWGLGPLWGKCHPLLLMECSRYPQMWTPHDGQWKLGIRYRGVHYLSFQRREMKDKVISYDIISSHSQTGLKVAKRNGEFCWLCFHLSSYETQAACLDCLGLEGNQIRQHMEIYLFIQKIFIH